MRLAKFMLLIVITTMTGAAFAQDGDGHGPPHARKFPTSVPAKSTPQVSAPAPKVKAARPARPPR